MDKQKEINIFKIIFLVLVILLLAIYIGWRFKAGYLTGPPLARKNFGVGIVILLYCIYLLYKEVKRKF